jgi:hypothetical protein
MEWIWNITISFFTLLQDLRETQTLSDVIKRAALLRSEITYIQHVLHHICFYLKKLHFFTPTVDVAYYQLWYYMSLAIIIHIVDIIITITGNDCECFKIKIGPEKINHKPETISRTLYEICWP